MKMMLKHCQCDCCLFYNTFWCKVSLSLIGLKDGCEFLWDSCTSLMVLLNIWIVLNVEWKLWCRSNELHGNPWKEKMKFVKLVDVLRWNANLWTFILNILDLFIMISRANEFNIFAKSSFVKTNQNNNFFFDSWFNHHNWINRLLDHEM